MTDDQVDTGIVVPAFNVADYAWSFFECLRAQTYQGFRLVVVDDCSTDGTYDLCVREGSWLGDRITVLRNERNLGPGQARNRGLDELCLDPPAYVTFLDVDDWFEPAYLEDLHVAAVDFAVDLSIAGIVRFEDEDGRVLATEMVSYPSQPFEDSSRLDELASINTCLYAKLYRFEHISHVRFRTMWRSEDTCWLFESLPYLKSVKFTNNALYHYRVRSASLSGSMGEDAYQDMHREFARHLRLFDSGIHAPYREMFECQVFIRSSIGGVTRLAFCNMARTFALARTERAWLEECMPTWRTNKYLSHGRWWGLGKGRNRQNALRLCARLYKCHAFALFVLVYYVVSQVLRREVRA